MSLLILLFIFISLIFFSYLIKVHVHFVLLVFLLGNPLEWICKHEFKFFKKKNEDIFITVNIWKMRSHKSSKWQLKTPHILSCVGLYLCGGNGWQSLRGFAADEEVRYRRWVFIWCLLAVLGPHLNLTVFSCKYFSCIYFSINYAYHLKSKIFLLFPEMKIKLFNSGWPEVAVLKCTEMSRLYCKE